MGHRQPSLGLGLRTPRQEARTRGRYGAVSARGMRPSAERTRGEHAGGTETGAARDLALLQHVHLRAPQRSVACGLLAGALGHTPGARAYMELEVALGERTPVQHASTALGTRTPCISID